MKKIIALQGRAQCGKTSTLNLLIDLLTVATSKHTSMPLPHKGDRHEIFKINGVTVGIATGGDTQAIVKQNCLFFQQNNCDVAFSAIRTKGKTCQDLDAFAKQYGLTVNKQSQNIVNDITKQYASNLAKAQELYNLI